MEKKKLYMKDGTTIEVKDFVPTSAQLIKVRLHRSDTNAEGLWAVIDEDTFKVYEKNGYSGYEYSASLRNAPLAFYPMNAWGLVIPIKMMGSNRPECDLDKFDIDKTIKNNIVDGLSDLFYNKNEIDLDATNEARDDKGE
jgi:hypothetical protein